MSKKAILRKKGTAAPKTEVRISSGPKIKPLDANAKAAQKSAVKDVGTHTFRPDTAKKKAAGIASSANSKPGFTANSKSGSKPTLPAKTATKPAAKSPIPSAAKPIAKTETKSVANPLSSKPFAKITPVKSSGASSAAPKNKTVAHVKAASDESGKQNSVGGKPSSSTSRGPVIRPVIHAVLEDQIPDFDPIDEDFKKTESGKYRLFAICPGNLDEMLRQEIEALPAKVLQTYPGGVEFEGTLETAYLANLKLRTASRVLLLVKDFKLIFKPEELYDAIGSIDWFKVFGPTSTFAIYLTDSQSRAQDRRIRVNPQFWALKAKDAIVDQFQERYDERPNVDRADPDITIRLHLHDQMLKVYLDLSGPSLHERGYRGKTLEAPIKENLAAGLLLLAGWDKACEQKTAFYDPFCGSGTLLIEAALIATRTAPGLFRTRFGFMSWKDHQPELFEKVYEQVKTEKRMNAGDLPLMIGSDADPEAIAITKENLRRAGMDGVVRVGVERFEKTEAPVPNGLLVTNPPYGVRLEEIEALQSTYQEMGSTFKHKYKGWTACVITSEKTLLHGIALKPSKKWALHNGGLESQFSLFQLY